MREICFLYVSSEDKRLHQKTCADHKVCCIVGMHWTKDIKNRQPIIATTWYFFRQILLEPLTVTGASASCFGEYRDILSQNLDENNSNQQVQEPVDPGNSVGTS